MEYQFYYLMISCLVIVKDIRQYCHEIITVKDYSKINNLAYCKYIAVNQNYFARYAFDFLKYLIN